MAEGVASCLRLGSWLTTGVAGAVPAAFVVA